MTVAQAAEQLLEAIDNGRKLDEDDKQLKCKKQFYVHSYYNHKLSLSSPLPSQVWRQSLCVWVWLELVLAVSV